MAVCSVFGCKNDNNIKRSKKDKNQSEAKPKLFRFPRDPKMVQIWLKKCGRKDKFNVKTAYVCSKHFTNEQYARNLQHELLNYCPKNARTLKEDAVPTENLPNSSAVDRRKQELSSKRKARIEKRNNQALVESLLKEYNTPVEVAVEIETAGKSEEILTPKEKELQEKITNHEQQIKSLQAEKMYLENQVLKLKHENFMLRKECSAIDNIFSPAQRKKLKLGGKRVQFSDDDMIKCTRIYESGHRAYKFLLEQGYPFPAVITLKKFAAAVSKKDEMPVNKGDEMEILISVVD